MQNTLTLRSTSFGNIEEKAFFLLVTLILFSVSLYIYFISGTILSVVDRTSASSEIKILNTKVSTLESEYMSSLDTTTNLEEVKKMGYSEISKIDYISRSTTLGFARQ